jgi:hypothetical protein
MKRAILVPVVLILAACAAQTIKDTQVPDTPDNRAIADVVEHYRQAIEQRDVASLKELVSRRYFTNAGTTADSSDDYGYEQLEAKVFPALREAVKSVQYTLTLKKVDVKGDRATADFEYYYKFFFVDGGKDRWMAKSDFARLEFAKENGTWRITGGL